MLGLRPFPYQRHLQLILLSLSFTMMFLPTAQIAAAEQALNRQPIVECFAIARGLTQPDSFLD